MSQQPFSLLLVDDNPVNREMWSLYLTHEDFRVKTAATGHEALQLVEEEPIDLVLLDVVMPDLDGFQVLERLRQRFPLDELPVIMATARDRSEDIVKGFELGASDYVTKPVNLEVLLARIQAQLRGRTPALTGAAAATRPTAAPHQMGREVQAGTVLEGKYRLEGLLGQGNCGTVYRATHLTLHRPVAVKLLALAPGAQSAQRLQREGVSACRIQHPNAVEVLDLSLTDTGTPYLVMELLQGRSLDEELKRVGRLRPRRAAEILTPLCEVLAEAHRVGVVHRDVKPQNVFLHHGRQGEVVKVLDFGIAKLVGEAAGPRLTLDGTLVGTPAYMAPERLADEPYDGRADVYSVGVLLYEMLTGRRPFIGSDLVELIQMHLHDDPRPLYSLQPDVSPAVNAVVLQALAKDPKRRPTAGELARSFTAAVASEGTAFAAAGAPPPMAAARGDDDTVEEWVATLLDQPRPDRGADER